MLTGGIAAGGELSGKLSGGEALGGRLSTNETLTGGLSSEGGLTGGLSDEGEISGKLTVGVAGIPKYNGPYEIAATAQMQTISVEGMQMREDLIIDPIPSNYGLITWNGSTLTVS